MADIAAVRRLPSKKANAGRCTAEERGTELYPTSPVATKALLQAERVPTRLFEPMAGLGHMARTLRENGRFVYCSDRIDYGWPLDEVRDFFAFESIPAGCEAIITNPAFSVSADFVRHGLKLCRTVYILNRLAFIEGAGRQDIIDGHLTTVFPFVHRLPTMHRWSFDTHTETWREWQGRKASSAMPMAFFRFDRIKNSPTVLKRISWKNPASTT